MTDSMMISLALVLEKTTLDHKLCRIWLPEPHFEAATHYDNMSEFYLNSGFRGNCLLRLPTSHHRKPGKFLAFPGKPLCVVLRAVNTTTLQECVCAAAEDLTYTRL